jgi:(4-alkanoyl-5-oxo-2,5-dihydrofuran-3-yl)methyl phosphate reductase
MALGYSYELSDHQKQNSLTELRTMKLRNIKHLITGATGEVGFRVVEHLLKRSLRPRVLVRNEAKARFLFGDRVNVFVGDLAEPASIRDALKGVETIYLVNVGPEIPRRDEAAAVLAKQEGVKRIIKLSSLDVEHGLAIGAWHERGEAAIRAVGIPFTFVRPTGFMSNLLAWAHSIKTEKIVRSSTADGRRPFIHSEDIAAVSVDAIVRTEYAGQTLSITGPDSLTFGEATATIAEAIGEPLKYQTISDEEAHERYSRVSGSRQETEAHVALWRAIREGRLAKVTPEVEHILGRKPIALKQWAEENAKSFLS